ncbi:MAG TPA: MFS transporter, partial [Candidatus Limnocylindrales bacterium]|nr:MFS transporter [Candidatus Limnocylindrales bacterium]
EFPSGYFADRVGYRRSLLVGALVQAVGWIVYARGESFGAIVAAEVVLGAGSAFISGADRALLWVSLAEDGRGHQYTRWEGRVRAMAQTSEALSAAAGGWLYSRAPRLPLWLQVPVACAVVGMVGALREAAPVRLAPHTSHLARALELVRFTLWHHRRLKAAMALNVVLGLATFVMVWLIQPSMQARGIAPAWFGPLWAGAHLWLAGVSLASGRLAAAFGVRATLLGCCLLVPLGYAGLAATASAWGDVFYLCFMTLRGLQGPILARVMQEDAPAADRASVLSLATLLFRLAFVFAGPPVGVLVDHAGMPVALVVLAAAFTAAALATFTAFARAHADRVD